MGEEPVSADIRFHGELIHLAARQGRPAAFPYPLTRKASIKDALEALGAPHTEIYRLCFNGEDADFQRILAPGDRVEVFPAKPPVDPTRQTLLRPPLPSLRFLVDVNVAKLGALLRLLNYDAAKAPGGSEGNDAALAAMAEKEGRFVLTRDLALLKRKKIVHGRLIRAVAPEDQLLEVMIFFGMRPPFRTFRRCLRCNVALKPVDKRDVLPRLEPKTKQYFEEFHRCPVCERVYWPGSHHEGMLRMMDGIIAKLSTRRDEAIQEGATVCREQTPENQTKTLATTPRRISRR